MNYYSLLGKSNLSLSKIIQYLFTIHNGQIEIEIVMNIPEEENPWKEYPFSIKGVNMNIVAHSAWQRKEKSKILISTLKPGAKKILFDFFYSNFKIPVGDYSSIIHPSCVISDTVDIKNGVVIEPGVIILPYCIIDNFVSINNSVAIGHHTIIREYTTIHPGAKIAGLCNIGKAVTVGMGAIIVDKVEIGDNAVISAGALITRSVPANVVAYGNPAKFCKKSKFDPFHFRDTINE